MAEILHFEILRKHGQTHKQTDRQTWALQYLALPLRGRGKYQITRNSRIVYVYLWKAIASS